MATVRRGCWAELAEQFGQEEKAEDAARRAPRELVKESTWASL